MKVSRFFIFVSVIFVIALVVYLSTTPSTKAIQFTGIIMGNDYIASPLVTGRLERLLVDEGSSVHAGELIAEINPSELQAARDSAAANITVVSSTPATIRRNPHHGRPANCRRPAASGSGGHCGACSARPGQDGAGSKRNHVQTRRGFIRARRPLESGAGHRRAELSRFAR